jgi:hypothetical protein
VSPFRLWHGHFEKDLSVSVISFNRTTVDLTLTVPSNGVACLLRDQTISSRS